MNFYKIKHLFFGLVAVTLLLTSCEPLEDDKPDLGIPPTAEDVTFTYEYDMDNPNIVHFTNTSDGFIAKWDLGNGSLAEGDLVSGAYALKGEYTVMLTIFNRAGMASNSQVISIEETNPAMLDTPDFNNLTGGADQLEGKVWVIDKTRPGHMGVGPSTGNTAEWWQAPPLDKEGLGLYDDEYTFKLIDFVFENENNGDTFVNGAHAGDFGGDPADGDQPVDYTPPANMNWSLTEADGKKFISITNGGTFGFYTGVSTYEVLTLEENELYVRFLDSKNPDLAWYQRLIPKGYTPPPPPESGTEFPVNFEDAEPTFDVFGGNTFAVIDNPDMSGINTSAKVGETTHGVEPWGGIATSLADPIDFSVNNAFAMKVWSPVTGIVRFKVETQDDPNVAYEVDVEITETNQWQELTFDFTGQESGLYDRIALFFDFGGPEGNTFYFDDLVRTSIVPGFSEGVLTGGSSKAWRLKPVAGALAVGPAIGSSEWWAVPEEDIEGLRACWFDDHYIFSTGGVYEYDAMGQIYAEAYMGVESDGCIDEGEVPADAQAWTSGTHSFSVTEGDPSFITVTGTGAFIGLPKAFNGGEYAAAPPEADGSVRYQVLDYMNDGDSETLVLTIDISEGEVGGSWWTITLEAVQ